jgi:ABC-type uncharacterized transport system permease subunit
MVLILATLTALAYLSATALLALRARRTLAEAGADASLTPGLPGASVLALLFHAALLHQTIWTASGVALDVFDAASLMCWVAALGLFAFALKRPLANIGALLMPVCAVVVLISAVWSGARPWSDPANLGFQTHVTTSVLAYSVLLLAVCQSLVLAFQESRLSNKRPGGLLRMLPPLTTQETLLFQLLGAGFFLLSLSLASGLVFIDDLFAQHLAHKTALAFLAWALFGALLWGRWRRGWRGKTAVRLVVAGFTVLLLAYFGSKLVLELVLERPWFAS